MMKYFREIENPTARLPADFMQGFLEVGIVFTAVKFKMANRHVRRVAIEISAFEAHSCTYGTCCE